MVDAKTEPGELPIEGRQWMETVQGDWDRIYNKFLADTSAMIDMSGGYHKVQVEDYGSGSFAELALCTNYWGNAPEDTETPSDKEEPEFNEGDNSNS